MTLKLIDPLFDKKNEVTAEVSQISGNKMVLAEVNNIPCWVNVSDRVCMPVKENEETV
jgi:hypothetical protein